MMVVMTPEATAEQIQAVVDKLEARGVHAKVMPGELTTAIGAIGDPEGVRELGLEGLAGVDQVIPISRPYKLASSELSHHALTAFDVDGRRVGARDTFCLIAGPCTVETPDQTRTVARVVAAAGASMLRGGAFKPRTSPFSVQWLKLHTHLPVIVDPSHATGDRRLVGPLARAAAAAGADGIIVEVHGDPEAALCDGPHQIYAKDFPAFAADVAAHAGLLGKKLA